jgi:hypothetical protein
MRESARGPTDTEKEQQSDGDCGKTTSRGDCVDRRERKSRARDRMETGGAGGLEARTPREDRAFTLGLTSRRLREPDVQAAAREDRGGAPFRCSLLQVREVFTDVFRTRAAGVDRYSAYVHVVERVEKLVERTAAESVRVCV